MTVKYRKLPGHVLVEDFLVPAGADISMLADASGVPYKVLQGIIRGQRRIDVRVAQTLGNFFQNGKDFWLELQTRFDAGESL